RLLRALPGVPGLIASIALQIITARLDPSVGGSGPHDLAVREDAFVGATRALSLLASTAPRRLTSVTIAIRPSSGRRDGKRIIMNF
ncbi:MAG TPA: hypothetical protein VJQ82_11280, partial [Terriglobales bacterium]|nr:hypothetical protein [Terriglobales bacterium]